MKDDMKKLEKAEMKKEKRVAHIMLRSIGAAGVGIGLFLLRFLVAPFLGDNEAALHAIAGFALCLIGFGAVMILLFLFRKSWLPGMYLAMIWVILPALLLKFALDAF